MRKMITKEVVVTNLKMATLEIQEGKPVAVPLPDESILGNVTLEKAQKIMSKRFANVTVFEATTQTKVYEMELTKFLEQATLKVEDKEEAKKEELSELERKRDEAQAKSSLKAELENLEATTKKAKMQATK